MSEETTTPQVGVIDCPTCGSKTVIYPNEGWYCTKPGCEYHRDTVPKTLADLETELTTAHATITRLTEERDELHEEFKKMSSPRERDEIQPCPFCGATEVKFERREATWKHNKGTFPTIVACCQECGATGRAFGHMSMRNEKVAKQYWNDRFGGVYRELKTALARVEETKDDAAIVDWLKKEIGPGYIAALVRIANLLHEPPFEFRAACRKAMTQA